jgi:hypothetical protein
VFLFQEGSHDVSEIKEEMKDEVTVEESKMLVDG